jgi:hypothetical protein
MATVGDKKRNNITSKSNLKNYYSKKSAYPRYPSSHQNLIS